MKLRRSLSCAAILGVTCVALGSTQPTTIWVDGAGHPTSNAIQALSLIERAADDGLLPDEYQYEELALLSSRLGGEPSRIEDRSRFEAGLSEAIIRLFHAGWEMAGSGPSRTGAR